ncbi:HAD-IIB family hydrolase [Mycoplasmoides alvi]|uniref:HAD-IIB family hydrolase n=1 Tax=Mycoplasmoides alvi TaxID=78580 RepID=UPI00051B457C|nr:HAD-IIB family hydrolase [Mycoplasmoides alvi]
MEKTKKKFRFLALDLDGTLLNFNKKISKQTLLALDTYAKLNPDSINAIITGRYYSSAKNYAQHINNNTNFFKIHYIGSGNGSFIFKVNKNIYKLLSKHLIPHNQAYKIYKLTKKYKILFWGCPDSLYKGAPIVLSWNYMAFAIHLVRPLDTHIIRWFLHDDFSKINVISRSIKKLDAFALELQNLYPNTFQMSRTSKKMIEITAFEVNKGQVVKSICDLEKISLDERIAIGDSNNDKSMFSNVGIKLSPVNAKKSLKKEATYVGTKHHNKRISCLFYDYLLKKNYDN